MLLELLCSLTDSLAAVALSSYRVATYHVSIHLRVRYYLIVSGANILDLI
jgi:hypothetical protein